MHLRQKSPVISAYHWCTSRIHEGTKRDASIVPVQPPRLWVRPLDVFPRSASPTRWSLDASTRARCVETRGDVSRRPALAVPGGWRRRRRAVPGRLSPADAERVPGRVGVDFVTNDELRTALAATSATPEQVDEAVAISEDARLRALRASFLIVGGISLLSIFPASRLPKYLPAELSAEDIVTEARDQGATCSPPPRGPRPDCSHARGCSGLFRRGGLTPAAQVGSSPPCPRGEAAEGV